MNKTAQTQKLNKAVGRIRRLWLWKLFWIFFWFNVVLFSAVAFHLGGMTLLTNWGRLTAELAFLYVPVFATQGIILLWQILIGRWQIRRRVRPLYEMAETADKLSTAVLLGAEKFHALETAISQISPTRADRLETGDHDLAGLEQAVNNLLEQMRENYRQQSRFVSDASHELRTPIAVIQGYVNMLDRWGKEDETVLAESIAAIQSESVHMQRLVEQLLFLARGDIGKIQLERATLDLAAMMKEVHDESVMIDESHEYRLVTPSEPVEAVGDPGLLKQVARILTDNAAKYSPAGSRITLKAGVNAEGIAFFQVQDEGQGMGAGDVPHIFERFYRSDSSRTKSTGGTGLGLAIAKWIVDKHGGYFDVLTRDGLGVRVAVCLPHRMSRGENSPPLSLISY
ncbi:MAG: HAMP domain-containing histidine kinase [Oscillospiraceae bacterium]|nr:HAMP domain-containing histidine kinase [Oscillospiraceae bacterium]